MVTLYGLPTCDSCRKAKKWLQEQGVDYTFVNVKENPPTPEQIGRWVQQAGWARILNKSSRTWRSLTDAERGTLADQQSVEMLCRHPALIKRPVAETSKRVLIGFKPEEYHQFFISSPSDHGT